MPLPDLHGKNLMIATSERIIAEGLFERLKKLGADVVFSNACYHSNTASEVIDEIKQYICTIDTLIIHAPNIALPECVVAVIKIVNAFKTICPIIVCDSSNNKVAIKRLRDAGATYLNVIYLDSSHIMKAVCNTRV